MESAAAVLACSFLLQSSGARANKRLVHSAAVQVAASPESGQDTTLGPGPAPPALAWTLHHQDQNHSPSIQGQILPCQGWEKAQQLTAGCSTQKWLRQVSLSLHAAEQCACPWVISLFPYPEGHSCAPAPERCHSFSLLQLAANHVVLEAQINTWLLQMCCEMLMAVPSCSLFTANRPYSSWSSHLSPKLWMGTVMCLTHLHKTLQGTVLPDAPCNTRVPSPVPTHQGGPTWC